MIPALLALACLAPDFASLKGAFLTAVKNERYKDARKAVAAIAKIKGSGVSSWLYGETDNAREAVVKRAFVEALAHRRWPGQRQFIADRLIDWTDPFHRATALRALAKLDPKKAIEAASNMLGDADRRARRTAVDVLARSGAVREIIVGCARLSSQEQGAILAVLRGLAPGKLAALSSLSWAKPPGVRVLALLAVAARADERFRDAFTEGRKDADPRVRLVATIGLARLAGASARGRSVQNLLKKAKSFRDRWELYDLIARGGLRDRALVEALAKAAKSGSSRLRAKAAESLGHAGGADAVPALAALLRAKKPWQVPLGATRGLAGTRSAAAIPPLIAALKTATGRFQFEIANALTSLTGQPFGRSAKVWERWWGTHAIGFRPPQVPKELWEEDTDANNDYVFYGIDLVSDRAAFICDKSGSMQGKRLDRLKLELTAVINRFPPHGRFNLVFFDAKIDHLFNKMVKANEKNRKKALAEINKVKAGGATNIWDALEFALKDKTVDTIVLLTDGAPTAGDIRDVTKIRDEFLKLNRERMVLLHVVAIGVDSPALAAAARLSGGSYVKR